MMKLFIETIDKAIDIENGIYQIKIENPITYRNIAINIDTEIILSNAGKIISLDKEVIIIHNPFNLDINDSKTIKALYKLLEKEIHGKLENELLIIEKVLFEISDKLILSSNINLDYEAQIDVSKLLSCLGIKYNTYDDYLSNLLQYIKIQSNLFSKKIIIFFGLSSMLSVDEINRLNVELINNDISLIDISFSIKNISNNSLIIDEDWCIL